MCIAWHKDMCNVLLQDFSSIRENYRLNKIIQGNMVIASEAGKAQTQFKRYVRFFKLYYF